MKPIAQLCCFQDGFIRFLLHVLTEQKRFGVLKWEAVGGLQQTGKKCLMISSLIPF